MGVKKKMKKMFVSGFIINGLVGMDGELWIRGLRGRSSLKSLSVV